MDGDAFVFEGRGQGHGEGLDVEWAKQSNAGQDAILHRPTGLAEADCRSGVLIDQNRLAPRSQALHESLFWICSLPDRRGRRLEPSMLPVHVSRMEHFHSSGFVCADTLTWEADASGLTLEGEIAPARRSTYVLAPRHPR